MTKDEMHDAILKVLKDLYAKIEAFEQALTTGVNVIHLPNEPTEEESR